MSIQKLEQLRGWWFCQHNCNFCPSFNWDETAKLTVNHPTTNQPVTAQKPSEENICAALTMRWHATTGARPASFVLVPAFVCWKKNRKGRQKFDSGKLVENVWKTNKKPYVSVWKVSESETSNFRTRRPCHMRKNNIRAEAPEVSIHHLRSSWSSEELCPTDKVIDQFRSCSL